MSGIQLTFVFALLAMLGFIALFSRVVVRAALDGGRGLRSASGRGELGRAAFLAHRLTGFAIFAFLVLHILDVGLVAWAPTLYDKVQHLYGSVELRVLECGLLFAVLFHTGNGLRLLAYDIFSLSSTTSRQLLVLVLALTALLGAGGSAVILAPVFR